MTELTKSPEWASWLAAGDELIDLIFKGEYLKMPLESACRKGSQEEN